MISRLYKIVVFGFCLAWIGKNIFLPVGAGLFFYDDYMRYAIACDAAMNSSWFIQQSGNEKLKNTEIVQMLDCHDYDKTRKIMLMSGLPENFLSYLGLRALEIYQRPASEFVELHRFRER